jgi:WD40 repeat protein/serine/threonine protein kinase
VEEACQGADDLRRGVEALLEAHLRADDLLPTPFLTQADTAPAPCGERPGTLVGCYRLLESIGEGGFGLVFLAEQQQPLRRRVALKILKPGMDSRHVIARFEAERQALALMDHPNIARIFDGGITDSSRPYFVMELVKGAPITAYCDQNQLTLRARLELFHAVCQAVQHAHHKGIIHRDLKPSNVLVTVHDGVAVVKVIDFGIAKALGQQLTDKTICTGSGQLLGTPLYMSPEQLELSSPDVDTRADIYALGVLLYELLTGTTPFGQERLQEGGFDAWRRIVREADPLRPSVRLATLGEAAEVSAQRQSDPKRLSRLLRGELDWIVLKALEKERARRYETAAAFAADVERYLRDETVEACRPSAWYRVRKFVRWHRGPVLAAALVFLTLLTGVIGTTWGLLEAQWQRDEAEQARLAEQAQRNQAEDNAAEAEKARLRALKAEAAAIALAKDKERLAQLEHDLRVKAEKLADDNKLLFLQARFEHLYFQSRENPALAMLGAARLLPETMRLKPRALENSILLHLGSWSQEIVPLRQCLVHQGIVAAAVFGPDGKTVLTGSWDNKGRLWEAATGKLLATLPHREKINAVAFSPDGKTVLTGSWDNTALLWEAATGKPLATLAHQGPVQAVAFSPDGKTVLTGSRDKTAQLWEAATSKPLVTLHHHDQVFAVAFSPDRKTVLTGSHDKTAQLWEVATGKSLFTLWHKNFVKVVAFSPDGKTVLTGSWDNTARLWKAATGKPLGPPLEHYGRVVAGAFSPDGKTVLTGSWDDRARLWEVTGKHLATLDHQANVDAVAFSPDGKTVVTGSWDNTARLWEATTGKPLATLAHQGMVRAVAFSPDGEAVLTGSRLWGSATGKPFAMLQHQGDVLAVAFSPDGKTVLTGSDDKTARLWEAATGKLLTILPHQDWVRSVAFSPDGQTVLTGSQDTTARLWEAATGKLLTILPHQNEVSAVAFSPDGKTVLTASYDKTARLWESATGKPLATLAHHAKVGPVAFSTDGKTVLTGSLDDRAQLWEVATGMCLAILKHETRVVTVAFSPDGMTVLTGSHDNTARLWEVATGKLLTILPHKNWVSAVAFSPDGKTVLTGSKDKTARLWEAATGKPLAILKHQNWVRNYLKT